MADTLPRAGGVYGYRPCNDSGVWVDRLEPCRAAPGEWLHIAHPAAGERWHRQTAYRIERGLYHGIDAGDYLAATRNCDGDNRCDLWVKYGGLTMQPTIRRFPGIRFKGYPGPDYCALCGLTTRCAPGCSSSERRVS